MVILIKYTTSRSFTKIPDCHVLLYENITLKFIFGIMFPNLQVE